MHELLGFTLAQGAAAAAAASVLEADGIVYSPVTHGVVFYALLST